VTKALVDLAVLVIADCAVLSMDILFFFVSLFYLWRENLILCIIDQCILNSFFFFDNHYLLWYRR
jgi:hypothetical protein